MNGQRRLFPSDPSSDSFRLVRNELLLYETFARKIKTNYKEAVPIMNIAETLQSINIKDINLCIKVYNIKTLIIRS